MPHFFLMNEDALSDIDAAILRSRLHVRGGKKLLDHNKLPHGIGTLYDAVEYGMRYWYLKHKNDPELPEIMIGDTKKLHQLILSMNIFSVEFDYTTFEGVMDNAIEERLDFNSFDKESFWELVKTVLTDLEVLPFDMNTLPEENIETKRILNISD